jgi:hypothetical protein
MQTVSDKRTPLKIKYLPKLPITLTKTTIKMRLNNDSSIGGKTKKFNCSAKPFKMSSAEIVQKSLYIP